MQGWFSRYRVCFTIAFFIPLLTVLFFAGCAGDPPVLPSDTDGAGGGRAANTPPTESHNGAHLDIRPGSCPNPLNLKAHGVLPVAVLGSGDFDVDDIDVTSLRLQGVEAMRSSIEDVATPVAYNDNCDCTPQGPDSFPDLVLHFRVQDIAIALGPISSFQPVRVTLTGRLLDGTPFAASDCVKIVGRQELPEIRFATNIRNVITPYNPTALDTVGMFRPFAISYHGIAAQGKIDAYRFFSLTPGVELDGANVWSTDLSDTVRVFANIDPQAIPSGIFRLAVQCRDSKGAVSLVDAATFRQGVCQVVINFEPDTELFQVLNTYEVGGSWFTEAVDFSDETPDTVPYRSWVTLFYRGSDRRSNSGALLDSSLCQDVVNECLRYQVGFTSRSDQIPGFSFTSRWLPDGGEDNNEFGTADSTSMNMGTVEYDLRVR
ncbi:MAG: hypothetical protein OEN01_16005, partial [Candidatus Krumholzibacteria bacterium]|nr:hypothetical protein [Candidatus Krumholzibacteria bacterium]